MKRFKLVLVLVILVMLASVCYGSYITILDSWYFSNSGFSVPTMTDYIILTPTTVPGSNVEGYLYWDDIANAPKWYNGSSWVTAGTTAAGTTLDGSYDLGSGITVDGNPVTLTVGASDDNAALHIVHGETTNDNDAIDIDNSADDAAAVSIQIDGTAGFDIQGTGDTWQVGIDGRAILVGLTVTTEDIELENGAEIQNVTDTELRFVEDNGVADEDFILDFGANVITFKSGTAVSELAMGTVDDLTGVGTIVFDDAASTITLTSTGATDLTISQATADQDASLILQSSGIGADAVSIITSNAAGDIKVSAGDILDIDAVDHITIDNSGAASDIRIDSALGSVYIEGKEEDADAVHICATGTASGINVDAGTDGLDIDTTGPIGIDCSEAADDIHIDSATGSVQLIGGEADAAAVVIDAENAAGGIDMDFGTGAMVLTGTGVAANLTIDVDALSLDFTDSSNITVTSSEAAEDFTISQIGGNDSSIIVTSAGTGVNAIELTTSNAAGDIDINAGDAITIDAGDVVITTDDAATAQFKVVAGGTHASTTVIELETTDGGIMLDGNGAVHGDIWLDAVDDVGVTAGDDVVITAGGAVTVVNTGDMTYSGVFLPVDINKQTITTGSLSTADCGYVNQVAVDAQTITLPATVTGVQFTIMCVAADGGAIVTVELDNADKFVGAGLTPDDGEAIVLTKVTQNRGDYIKVSAHTDGWIITEMVGTWAEASP